MFEGVMTALVTPFRDGAIDEPALRALVERQIEAGIDGLVPCGSTGESATLSHDEHERVIDIVVDAAAGRVPVVAGTGSNNTEEAIRLTQHAKEAGASGALLISPYYNKPTQSGSSARFSRKTSSKPATANRCDATWPAGSAVASPPPAASRPSTSATASSCAKRSRRPTSPG